MVGQQSPQPTFPAYPETPLRGATITIANGRTTVAEKVLPADPTPPLPAATAEQVERAEVILRRVGKFLGSKPSIKFKAQKHIDEEGTMGFVNWDQQISLAYARPNKLSYKCDFSGRVDYFVEVICDGKSLMRRDYGRCYVESAPESLEALIDSLPLKPSDSWRFNAPTLLRLFSPENVEKLLASCEVSHRGTREFGDVTTDMILIDAGGPTPDNWWAFRWELYIARGEVPVPVYCRPNLDGLFPSLAGKDRWSATDVRFTDWSFDPAANEAFRVEVKAGEELVDSRVALAFGEQGALNPMVGQPLPDFSAADQEGKTVTKKDLFGEGPAVLVLWGSKNAAIGPWWGRLDAVRQKYAGKGVRFQTLHIGDDTLLQSGLDQWNAKPPVWKLVSDPAPFAQGSLEFEWNSELQRKPVAPGMTIQAYVVAADGVVQQVIGMGPKLMEELSDQIEGLLQGRDMAAKNEQLLRARKAARERMRRRLNNEARPEQPRDAPATRADPGLSAIEWKISGRGTGFLERNRFRKADRANAKSRMQRVGQRMDCPGHPATR